MINVGGMGVFGGGSGGAGQEVERFGYIDNGGEILRSGSYTINDGHTITIKNTGDIKTVALTSWDDGTSSSSPHTIIIEELNTSVVINFSGSFYITRFSGTNWRIRGGNQVLTIPRNDTLTVNEEDMNVELKNPYGVVAYKTQSTSNGGIAQGAAWRTFDITSGKRAHRVIVEVSVVCSTPTKEEPRQTFDILADDRLIDTISFSSLHYQAYGFPSTVITYKLVASVDKIVNITNTLKIVQTHSPDGTTGDYLTAGTAANLNVIVFEAE